MRSLNGFRHYIPRTWRPTSEQGFSLVETLAALIVFALITLGLVPLLAASIRGSNTSRTTTVGKNLAVEAMERVRGFPFYISYSSQPRKVDVLDLFFPQRTPAFTTANCTGYLASGSVTCASTGYTATGPSYITTCPNAANIACPQNIPTGYTLTFDTSFVNPTSTTPETYTRATPGTTYAYTSATTDRPQTLLVQMSVTARWTAPGRGPRTYQIRSLLSDRQFSGVKILGDATVDFGVKLITGFSSQGSINATELTATAGHAVSHIETRRVATASQLVRAGQITLIDVLLAEDAIDGNENLDSTPRLGAEETVVAPPDATVNPSTVAVPAAVSHPSGSYDVVAELDTTDSDSASATTTGALPAASGDFDFSSSSSDDILITNKRADTGGNPLNLANFDEWVARVVTKSGDATSGVSSATTNALGTQPGVASSATVSFKELHLFPTDYIEDRDDRFDGAVVAITGPVSGGSPSGMFSATASCNADNDLTQNANAAVGTYSGTLWYWRDPTENDNRSDAGYATVNLTPGTDALGTIASGAPVLVYDTNPDTKDIYLFNEGGNYYLESWSNLATPTTSITTSGRVTQVGMESAVTINTAPMEGSSDPETAIAVQVGGLSCRAEDYR